MFSVADLQGGGIGKHVLAECERIARDEWRLPAMRMTVIDIRDELITFYERRGYRCTGITKPFLYGDARFWPAHPRRFWKGPAPWVTGCSSARPRNCARRDDPTAWDGDTAIAVFNHDGAFYALEDRCSHEGLRAVGRARSTGDRQHRMRAAWRPLRRARRPRPVRARLRTGGEIPGQVDDTGIWTRDDRD